MVCPVCKYESLAVCELEEDLKSFQCKMCKGNWVELEDYLNWDFAKASNLEDKFEEMSQDVKEAKQCCKCQRIMQKFSVASSLEFSLDRCMTCGGIWFDCLEWDLLKKEGLVDKLNFVFTSAWQEKIRKEKSIETLELLYKNKFGQDYEKIRDFKNWLNSYEHKEDFFAYLKCDLIQRD